MTPASQERGQGATGAAGLSHRLSVVWFTDLVGYSSLSARDHDRALALVQRFQQLVGRTVPGAEGRVVKFLGDAALLESPTAESALEAARALHAQMGEGSETITASTSSSAGSGSADEREDTQDRSPLQQLTTRGAARSGRARDGVAQVLREDPKPLATAIAAMMKSSAPILRLARGAIQGGAVALETGAGSPAHLPAEMLQELRTGYTREGRQIVNHATLAPLRSDPRFDELKRKLGLT